MEACGAHSREKQRAESNGSDSRNRKLNRAAALRKPFS